MNDMVDRGKIRNPANIARLRDFSSLRFGTITPTDIDAFMEFGGKSFIFIEAKRHGYTMPYGQRLALERLCDACSGEGRKSTLIIVEHDDEDIIDFGPLHVREIRFEGQWITPESNLTLRQTVKMFLSICEA